MKVKSKVIMFCPLCKWKIINPDKIKKTNTCPKCNAWTFEIFEHKHYKNGKLMNSEFGLTDNDECFFEAYSYNDAKKIWNKATKLFRKLKKEQKKNDRIF